MLLTERIKELADSQNTTFAALERDAELGRGTIRRWDSSCPSADKLLKVANLLHTSLDYLMTGSYPVPIASFSDEEKEIVNLLRKLPRDVIIEFKGELKGYLKCLNDQNVLEDLPQAK